MNSSILVSTLGANWQVIPELLGWTNPDRVDLYQEHEELARMDEERTRFNIEPVDEIWILTTSGSKPAKSLEELYRWFGLWNDGKRKIQVWKTEGVEDINTLEEIRLVRELIWRSVLHAKEQCASGQLLLSLAGGRKTMSADMHSAAIHFGTRALLHVIDREQIQGDGFGRPEDFLSPFTVNRASRYLPVVLGQERANPLLEHLHGERFPLPKGSEESVETYFNCEGPWFIDIVNQEVEQSRHLSLNYRHQLLENNAGTNFLNLYTLNRERLEGLQKTRFGLDPTKESEELLWLEALPKSELHCHLGGVLKTEDMIRVAEVMEEEVREAEPKWLPILGIFQPLIENEDLDGILTRMLNHACGSKRPLKSLRQIPGLHEPLGVCAFILLFKENPGLLENFLNRVSCLYENRFESYESSGDLQGSGLLQNGKTVYATTKIWLEHCRSHNVKYLELRCSPVNYTRGGMTQEEVVTAIREACCVVPEVETRLLFIGSRHGHSEDLKTHIDLASKLLDASANEGGLGSLVGFDLAGAEEQRSPAELRDAFLPLLQRCLSVTIHAGETEPAQSIWEAVYHLQADRIGHGLTLKDSSELIPRFRDRRIGIELCPASNMKIVGYRDSYFQTNKDIPVYPLREYLDAGLRVTINTDNPGISKTNPTRELHRAARMTEGGLSQWEILLLVRNSFRATFADHQTRSRLLREAEKSLMTVIQQHPP